MTSTVLYMLSEC